MWCIRCSRTVTLQSTVYCSHSCYCMPNESRVSYAATFRKGVAKPLTRVLKGCGVIRNTSRHCSNRLCTLQDCMKSRDTERSFPMHRKVLLLTTQQVVTQPWENTSQMTASVDCRSGIYPCTKWRVRGRQVQGIHVQWVQCMAGWSTSAHASYGQLSAC